MDTHDLTTHVVDHGSRWQLSLLEGGEAVSGVGIVKSSIRIGTASVRMAGIAGLWTSPDHRLKGYGSRSMWEAIRLMEAEGCDASVLFGITDFYHRYGYAPVFPDVALSLCSADLPHCEEAAVRRMRRSDLADVVRLYNAHSGARTGMVVRGRDWAPGWRMPRMGEDTVRRAGRVTVVCRPSGRIAAYYVSDIQAGRFHVSELGVSDPWSCLALAGALRRRAARLGIERIRVHVPPDDPFARFGTRFGSEHRTAYPSNSGSMGRIIRLAPLFRKLLPTLTGRLGDAEVRWERPLELHTDIGTVCLNHVSGCVVLSRMPPAQRPLRVSLPILKLTQLAFGYRAVADISHDAGVSIPGAALPILDVLFPVGTPYMWWSDRF
jgi:GNAT superfamily N-acetyltransferase